MRPVKELSTFHADKLKAWLDSGEYLPKFMRDFHRQKDLFKQISSLYRHEENAEDMPGWVTCHIYVIDWFLYFMASRGYTLQKSSKNLLCREYIPYDRGNTDD